MTGVTPKLPESASSSLPSLESFHHMNRHGGICFCYEAWWSQRLTSFQDFVSPLSLSGYPEPISNLLLTTESLLSEFQQTLTRGIREALFTRCSYCSIHTSPPPLLLHPRSWYYPLGVRSLRSAALTTFCISSTNCDFDLALPFLQCSFRQVRRMTTVLFMSNDIYPWYN